MVVTSLWIALALLGGAALVGGGTAVAKAVAELKKAWHAKRDAKGAQ